MRARPPRWMLEVVETLALTLVVFWVIQSFVAQPFQVRQTSMQHTVEPDQYVLVDKLTPRFDGFHRGDIVVLEPPPGWQDEYKTPFIKRVVGLPGERVEIREDGYVYVDGMRLDEAAYLFREDGGDPQPTEIQVDQSTWTIGPGQLFVMGDHRQVSVDSRSFGPIPVATVVGRAFLRYWPASAVSVLARPTYAAAPSPVPSASPAP